MNTDSVVLDQRRFDRLTVETAADAIISAVKEERRGWLATVNVAILVQLRKDRQIRRFVDGARWVVADGQPIVWLSRLLGKALPSRVTGIDLVEEMCARASREGIRIFLLGADAEVSAATTQALRSRYPGVDVVSRDGYFDLERPAPVVDSIRESGAHVLFVGMGVPRQERFIEENWQNLGVAVAVGVGGSFDVIGGPLRRAPGWAQRTGLEWTFRLAQEPRRLWRRYLVTGTQFMGLSMRVLAQSVFGPRA